MSREPQAEQTRRLCQSRTGVSAPYRSAIVTGLGSARWLQALYQVAGPSATALFRLIRADRRCGSEALPLRCLAKMPCQRTAKFLLCLAPWDRGSDLTGEMPGDAASHTLTGSAGSDRQYNKARKTIKWGYRNPTRRITFDSVITATSLFQIRA